MNANELISLTQTAIDLSIFSVFAGLAWLALGLIKRYKQKCLKEIEAKKAAAIPSLAERIREARKQCPVGEMRRD